MTNKKEYYFNADTRIIKGTDFWTEEIKKAGVAEKLVYFSDVLTGKEEPSQDNKKHLVLKDVTLDGKNCDVYHFDQDEQGNHIRNSTASRIFIHIKE